MGIFDSFKNKEARSLENPTVPVSENFLHLMGWGDHTSQAGVTVNVDAALGVPAIWAATNFISGTLASLPLEVHRNGERVTTGIGAWIDRAVNPTTSSFAWRKYIFEQVLTGGRSVTLIVKNGEAMSLIWCHLIQQSHMFTNKRQILFQQRHTDQTQVYDATEVIDLTFMLKHNQLDIRGPIMTNKDIIGLAIAAIAWLESVPERRYTSRCTSRAIPVWRGSDESIRRCSSSHSKTRQRGSPRVGTPSWS